MSLGSIALKDKNGARQYYQNVGIIRVPNATSIHYQKPEWGTEFYNKLCGQSILMTIFGRQAERPYVDPPIQLEPGPGYLFFDTVATRVFNPSAAAATIVNVTDDITAAGCALAKNMKYENGVLSWDGYSQPVDDTYRFFYSCPYTVEIENHAETEKTVSFSWPIEVTSGVAGYLQINGKNIAAEGVLSGNYSKALAAGEILYVTAVTAYSTELNQPRMNVSLSDFAVT